ncbi:Ig-like domain-containing protein [Anaerocolumna sp. MB42-C2]|uniref:Ig-like domain-containing protein n=1 Tax=Anaerocolumna sp. MB42-C2 TaxID=3070997 RepID=UPI0027DFD47C|nr:Ig-like domain-containing protein [Anaerocolumna sp. MB42-C2]WMJ88623.1 Ig-like domain-containing protein [Anaerocolumna sp. MB42-C2]
MNKLFKKIAVLLCVMFITPAVLNCISSTQDITKVEAAANVKVELNNKIVGICSTPEYLYIVNAKSGAQYTYVSSNTEIATVSKDGKITGVGAGTVKITTYETYQGKKTKIETKTISVVNSLLDGNSMEVVAHTGYLAQIQYMNNKAKYTYTSSDPSIVTTDKDGFIVGLKGGSAILTVTETYKKEQRTLGAITVNVTESSISDESKKITVGVNSDNNVYDIIPIVSSSWDSVYSYESADSKIVSFESKEDGLGDTETILKGVNPGTTNVTIYETYAGVKRTIGTVEVTVKEIPITSMKIENYYLEEDGSLPLTYYVGNKGDFSLSEYLVKEPYNGTTSVMFTSSDESIVKVDQAGYVEPVKGGNAVITASCGDFSVKFSITVLSY